MGADRVGLIDVSVVRIAPLLHLRLHRLHPFAFAQELMIDLDAGDCLEGLGEGLGFVLVGGNSFLEHVDRHAFAGLSGFDEPLPLLHPPGFAQHGRLEFAVNPLFRRRLACRCAVRSEHCDGGRERHSF